MKILLQQSGNQLVYKGLINALEKAGVEYTFDPLENADYGYFGNNNNYNNYITWPDNLTSRINLDLTLKLHLQNLAQEAGINYVPTEKIENSDTILNFETESVFIKPIEGALSRTPYTFVYKVFDTKQQLLDTILSEAPDFFDVKEDGTSICSTHVIQKGFKQTTEGYLQTFFVPGYINGQGRIVTEGIGDSKLAFNELNDIDDESFPIRNMRLSSFRNTEDQQDKYGVLEQLQKLVDYYSIKNTPISTQWILEDGKTYLTDVAYNFQRSLVFVEDLNLSDFMVDKIKYIYDLQPDVNIPQTGWTGLVDFIITSDYVQTMEYINSLGFHYVKSWMPVTQGSKIKIFCFVFDSEEECLEKIDLVRNYIRDNTLPNTLLF